MRRHVIFLTDAQFALVRQALEYIVMNAGQADYDGDHDERDAARYERALAAIDAQPRGPRDTHRDADALGRAINIMTDMCSCENRDKGHRSDCWTYLLRAEIDRLVSLRYVLDSSARSQLAFATGRRGEP